MVIRHLINDTYTVWNNEETTCWHQGTLASCHAYVQEND